MHLIFDLDGTLIDSRVGIVESLLFSTSKVLGKDFDVNLLQIGPPIKAMVGKIFPNIPDGKVKEVTKCFREHYDSVGWIGFSAYPNVKKVLEILKKDNILSIATNKPEKPTKKILQEMNVLHLFDEVFCYSNDRFKSKSDMVSSLKSDNSIEYKMIGDSTDDCVAAYDNDIAFIQCMYGYGTIDSSKVINSRKILEFNELIRKEKM
jgi:phosphoglycolate phosphatase